MTELDICLDELEENVSALEAEFAKPVTNNVVDTEAYNDLALLRRLTDLDRRLRIADSQNSINQALADDVAALDKQLSAFLRFCLPLTVRFKDANADFEIEKDSPHTDGTDSDCDVIVMCGVGNKGHNIPTNWTTSFQYQAWIDHTELNITTDSIIYVQLPAWNVLDNTKWTSYSGYPAYASLLTAQFLSEDVTVAAASWNGSDANYGAPDRVVESDYAFVFTVPLAKVYLDNGRWKIRNFRAGNIPFHGTFRGSTSQQVVTDLNNAIAGKLYDEDGTTLTNGNTDPTGVSQDYYIYLKREIDGTITWGNSTTRPTATSPDVIHIQGHAYNNADGKTNRCDRNNHAGWFEWNGRGV